MLIYVVSFYRDSIWLRPKCEWKHNFLYKRYDFLWNPGAGCDAVVGNEMQVKVLLLNCSSKEQSVFSQRSECNGKRDLIIYSK